MSTPPRPIAAPDRDWTVKNIRCLGELWPAIDQLLDALHAAGFSQKRTFAARLALEEAISNGIKHGNKNDPAKSVAFRWRLRDGLLSVEVEDEGPGFNPEDVPDPLAPENLEREGGRGLLLIRSYMSQVTYNERGNCIRMELRNEEKS